MNILIAVVHHWNPEGGGNHQSLRPDPNPRINALQDQILSLRRSSINQSVLHLEDRAVYRTNDVIDIILISIITDGKNHV